MELSLPAWLGALCGMIVAAAIYVPGIRIVERRLRAANAPETNEQRSAFEDKLSVVRARDFGFRSCCTGYSGILGRQHAWRQHAWRQVGLI